MLVAFLILKHLATFLLAVVVSYMLQLKAIRDGNSWTLGRRRQVNISGRFGGAYSLRHQGLAIDEICTQKKSQLLSAQL